jgi:predicted thioesterase
MFEMITTGLTGELHTVVSEQNTATRWGSGALYVFSTPNMIALMEGAAVAAVTPYLPAGHESVGTLVNVRHLASVPVGNRVEAHATLTEVDGRRLVFAVVAYSGDIKIGEGTHERFIVGVDRFMAKTATRRQVEAGA